MEPWISSVDPSQAAVRTSPRRAWLVGALAVVVVCLTLLTGCAGDRHLNGDWELGAGGGRLRTAPGGGAAPLTGLSGLRIDGDQATVLVQDSSGGFVPAIESLTLTTDDGRLTLMTPDDQIVTAYDDVLFTGAYWFNNGALVLELDDGAHIIFLPL